MKKSDKWDSPTLLHLSDLEMMAEIQGHAMGMNHDSISMPALAS